MSRCQLNIQNSTFQNNSAIVQGGAISYNYNHPRITESSFINNSAAYGNNLGSYPIRIGFVSSTSDDEISIKNIGPGITIDEPLKLALLDQDGQVMSLDSTSQINIVPTNSSISSVTGTNVITVSEGVSIFDSMAFLRDPMHNSIPFSISSKSINKAKVADVKGSSFTQKNLIVSFRD